MTRDLRARKLYELRALRAGGRVRVDAQPAREHVLHLARTLSYSAIAAAAGVSQSTVSRVVAGRYVHMNPDVSKALLAVRPNAGAGVELVSAVGTARRLRALRCLGWPNSDIAPHVGVTRQALGYIASGRTVHVSARLRDAVMDVYDELSMRTPVATSPTDQGRYDRARRLAQRMGFLPPLSWDDDTIDDPDAEPAHARAGRADEYLDEAAIVRRCNGDHAVALTNAERREVVRRLHSRGLNDGEIERLAGISKRQLLRDRKAQGLPANADSGRKEVAA
ncbi:MAG TPA: hypothetical protein VGF17_10145 [Phytomonospora sp.]